MKNASSNSVPQALAGLAVIAMKTPQHQRFRAIDLLLFMVLANTSCSSYLWPASQVHIAQESLSEDLELVTQIRDKDPESKGVFSISVSPNGRFLAWRDRINRLTVYDLDQKKKLFLISPHDANWIQSIQFAPDSQSFVTVAGSGESVKVWETATGKLIRRIKCDAEVARFSRDGAELAILGSKQVEVYSLTKPNRQRAANWRLKSELPLTMSADGKLVVSHRKLNQRIHQLELYNLDTRIRIDLPSDPTIPNSTHFSPDKRWLASSFENLQRLHLWKVEDPRSMHFLLDGHRDPITSFAFSTDSRFLATGSDSQMILWDLLTQQSIKSIELTDLPKQFAFETEMSLGSAVDDAKAWDERGKLPPPMKIRSLAFSPYRHQLAMGTVQGEDSVVSVFDLSPIFFPGKGPVRSAEQVWIDLGSNSSSSGLTAATTLIQDFPSFETEIIQRVSQRTVSNDHSDVDTLIRQLSSENFREREFATDQLARRSNQLSSTLQKKAEQGLDLETRYRLRKVLTKQTTTNKISSEEYRRWSRLIFGLESVGSEASKKLLERIQNGHSDSSISDLASEALERIATGNW